MPLNWNLERCENWNELTETDNAWGITNALIWTTMVIGMNEITVDNADEFFARVDTVQKATGQLAYQQIIKPDTGEAWVPYFITHEDIVRRVGLHTNASRLTKTKFFQHVERISEYNARRIKSLFEDALKSIPVKA